MERQEETHGKLLLLLLQTSMKRVMLEALQCLPCRRAAAFSKTDIQAKLYLSTMEAESSHLNAIARRRCSDIEKVYEKKLIGQ